MSALCLLQWRRSRVFSKQGIMTWMTCKLLYVAMHESSPMVWDL